MACLFQERSPEVEGAEPWAEGALPNDDVTISNS